MTRSIEVEVKVGIFVALGVGLIMLTILLLGGGTMLFQRGSTFYAKFPQIEGLVEGATVKIAGVKVGQVNQIKLLDNSGDVHVTFTIAKKFRNAVRNDSIVGIQTQGVLGDRYLVVYAGTPGGPPAPDNSELKTELPKDLKDYLTNADEVLDRLKNSLSHVETILGSFARDGRAEAFFRNMTGLSNNINNGTKDLRKSMERLNSVIAKIDSGQGTVGALINDPSLYDDIKTLVGGANRNRVLKYFIKKSVEDSREASREKK
ncbi:MAG: MlaD family protein [Bdellovibrionota bacterium]